MKVPLGPTRDADIRRRPASGGKGRRTPTAIRAHVRSRAPTSRRCPRRRRAGRWGSRALGYGASCWRRRRRNSRVPGSHDRCASARATGTRPRPGTRPGTRGARATLPCRRRPASVLGRPIARSRAPRPATRRSARSRGRRRSPVGVRLPPRGHGLGFRFEGRFRDRLGRCCSRCRFVHRQRFGHRHRHRHDLDLASWLTDVHRAPPFAARFFAAITLAMSRDEPAADSTSPTCRSSMSGARSSGTRSSFSAK